MIIVHGSVLAQPEYVKELVQLSVEHAQRSRLEPGCIAHTVHLDAEEPRRVVFVEKWSDAAALKAHFGVPAVQDFVRVATTMAAEAPTIEVFEATQLPMP